MIRAAALLALLALPLSACSDGPKTDEIADASKLSEELEARALQIEERAEQAVIEIEQEAEEELAALNAEAARVAEPVGEAESDSPENSDDEP